MKKYKTAVIIKTDCEAFIAIRFVFVYFIRSEEPSAQEEYSFVHQ